MSVLDSLAERLDDLRAQGLDRRLEIPRGIDFSSNDYLGLSRDPAILAHVRGFPMGDPLGAPASRLLRGHLPSHVRLEERLAAFKGTEAALLFPSGWQANVGLLTALLGKEDRVLSDALNHASLIDGIRLSRCHKVIFPHLDVDALAAELARPWPGRTFVVTESLFSMDGDVAPLDRYADLCDAHGAALIVDDAHATGLWGDERGSGLAEHFGVEKRVLALVSTGGKALGVGGGFVAGPRILVDFLVQTSRSFIFSTAVPPLLVRALEGALDAVASRPELRARLHRNAERLRSRLRIAGLGPIVPIIVGGNDEAVAAARRIQGAGFDVRAVRPPTVAPGTARLRISVHADHADAQLDALADTVTDALADAPRPAPAAATVGAAP